MVVSNKQSKELYLKELKASVSRILDYQVNANRNKPNTYRNKNIECPFCNFYNNKGDNKVITRNGNQMLIENKFPVYSNAHQTVLVENSTCQYDLSNYNDETLFAVLSFGLLNWLEMSRNKKYASVVFFKNHGLNSGGSITHPHMQIVGLYDTDYKQTLESSNFEGLLIDKSKNVNWNISNQPKSEFYEFNVIVPKDDIESHLNNNDNESFMLFCKYIQRTTHFILTELNTRNLSYNFCFYEFEDKIIAKIIPRGCNFASVTSPYLLGYGISQVPSDIQEVAEKLKNHHKKDPLQY